MNRNAPGYVLGFMAVLCTVFGLGVSVVHYATRDMQAANERLNHNRAVAAAFRLEVEGRSPADYARAMARNLERVYILDETGERTVYRQIDEPGRVGFTFSGMGFWDRIDGFLAFESDRQTVAGLRFFDHQETPGLGGRMEEPAFLEQFEGLRIDWDAAADRRIVINGAAAPAAGHRVDAITGATQTSTALMTILNEELERMRALDLDEIEFQPVAVEPEESP